MEMPLPTCCPLLYKEISELSLKRVAEPRRPWRSCASRTRRERGRPARGLSRAPHAGLCGSPVRLAFLFCRLQTVFVFQGILKIILKPLFHLPALARAPGLGSGPTTSFPGARG